MGEAETGMNRSLYSGPVASRRRSPAEARQRPASSAWAIGASPGQRQMNALPMHTATGMVSTSPSSARVLYTHQTSVVVGYVDCGFGTSVDTAAPTAAPSARPAAATAKPPAHTARNPTSAVARGAAFGRA